MKRLITAAGAATLLAVNASPATAGDPNTSVNADGTTIGVRAPRQAAPFTEQTAIPSAVHAPMALNPRLELPSMATLIQPADPGYDQWRAAMDAASGKRRRGMILTVGGLLGGPLVGGAVGTGAVKAGAESAGVGAAALIGLAGLGVGVYGIFQWISGHSEMSDLRRDGERAGYVSVSPIRGGAVGTVALSF